MSDTLGPTIFLSGGTKRPWRDPIVAQFPSARFYDPSGLGGNTMRAIAQIEREWLDACDLVFFYFEADNPSGIGSAFEVGYSVAHGIPVIFVDEKQTTHTEWLGYHCSQTFGSLEAGLSAMKQFIGDWKSSKA